MGYTYEKKFNKPTYTTSLTLSPNFGSTYQLYGDIDFYETLIKEQNFEKLKIHLGIDSSESKSLVGISIRPYTNELLKLKKFKDLLGTADSITATKLNYENYSENIPFDSLFKTCNYITIKYKQNTYSNRAKNNTKYRK